MTTFFWLAEYMSKQNLDPRAQALRLDISHNSVEGAEDARALNAYEDDDDDFLNTNCDTEDIEIF